MAKCIICGKKAGHSTLSTDIPEPICDYCGYRLHDLQYDNDLDGNSSEYLSKYVYGIRNEAARKYVEDLLFSGKNRDLAGQLTPEEFEALRQEEKRLAEATSKMPITSGYSFDGYRIKRYGGYVSGDEVVSLSSSYFMGLVQLGTGIDKDTINDAISEVRRMAINEMKAAAAALGCNAIIGLDFDYINIDLGHESVDIVHIILTANGTAVEIEKL